MVDRTGRAPRRDAGEAAIAAALDAGHAPTRGRGYAAAMKVFGVAGHSGMGKTTLLERLVPELRSRGLSVSLIKHSHKDIEIDRPGKDSYRLREAGCMEVLLLGDKRWALMHEQRGAPEPSLDYLLDRMQACDLVLVEGFKGDDFPKLEVWRAAVGKPLLWPAWPGIVAVASDRPLPTGAVTGLDLHDTAAVADFVVANAKSRGWVAQRRAAHGRS